MNKDADKIELAKNRIRFWLRQANSNILPKELPTSIYITELVDQETAQRLYEEINKELQLTSKGTINKNTELQG